MGREVGHAHEHEHAHKHAHAHEHAHEHAHAHHHDRRAQDPPRLTRVVRMEVELLEKNRQAAERNRRWLAEREIVALNLMSAPGAGKTTLLVETLGRLGELPVSVVEGDQETARDAERVRATGRPVVQVNTGPGCHLDAEMIERALAELDPPRRSLLLIENVGNLVCPALFDLGEQRKIVITSVTEGEDKPLKYPHVFRASEVMVLSKIDLLPHVDVDAARCLAYARQVNPSLLAFELSATRGDGLGPWVDWLRAEARSRAPGDR
jgi:hydrogenase nickel incorporation protein HypB